MFLDIIDNDYIDELVVLDILVHDYLRKNYLNASNKVLIRLRIILGKLVYDLNVKNKGLESLMLKDKKKKMDKLFYKIGLQNSFIFKMQKYVDKLEKKINSKMVGYGVKGVEDDIDKRYKERVLKLNKNNEEFYNKFFSKINAVSDKEKVSLDSLEYINSVPDESVDEELDFTNSVKILSDMINKEDMIRTESDKTSFIILFYNNPNSNLISKITGLNSLEYVPILVSCIDNIDICSKFKIKEVPCVMILNRKFKKMFKGINLLENVYNELGIEVSDESINKIKIRKYFVNWCKYCQLLKPVWLNLKEIYANNENIEFEEIDCEQQNCKNVTSYPTIHIGLKKNMDNINDNETEFKNNIDTELVSVMKRELKSRDLDNLRKDIDDYMMSYMSQYNEKGSFLTKFFN